MIESLKPAETEFELLSKAKSIIGNMKIELFAITIMPLVFKSSEARSKAPELYWSFRSDIKEFVKNLEETTDKLKKVIAETEV